VDGRAARRRPPAAGLTAWWREAVVYHVYPRSFADSDGDGVGDLRGITAHLGHLAGAPGALGVDAIWLSPVYRSPMVDLGYDVADHCDVDPVFGTLADLDELVGAAHDRGLRVLLDLVPNHTSDRHPWFVESRASRDGPRRDFYVWADPGQGGGPPNNWLSAFAATGAAWTLDPTTGQYYLHSYTPQQPDLNWWNPEVREAVHDVLRFWLRRGVDGFRVDAPHRMVKDPLLRDNPPDLAGHRLAVAPAGRAYRNIDLPEVQEVLRGFREVVDAFGAVLLVGEVGVSDPARLTPYYMQGRLDLAFPVAFWRQGWSAEGFRRVVADVEAALPPGAWPDYALSNHDIPRAATRFAVPGDPAASEARARLAAVLLLTLRGTPFLYQGEEIGMRDVPVDPADAVDPDGRDPCRTPLPWDRSAGGGFSTGRPWLPLGQPPPGGTVAEQRADPGSVLALHRDLLRLRRASPALRRGAYRALTVRDPAVLAHLRTEGDERVVVALNFGAAQVPLALDAAELAPAGPLPPAAPPGHGVGAELLLSSAPDRVLGPVDPAGGTDVLAAYEAVVLRLDPAAPPLPA